MTPDLLFFSGSAAFTRGESALYGGVEWCGGATSFLCRPLGRLSFRSNAFNALEPALPLRMCAKALPIPFIRKDAGHVEFSRRGRRCNTSVTCRTCSSLHPALMYTLGKVLVGELLVVGSLTLRERRAPESPAPRPSASVANLKVARLALADVPPCLTARNYGSCLHLCKLYCLNSGQLN